MVSSPNTGSACTVHMYILYPTISLSIHPPHITVKRKGESEKCEDESERQGKEEEGREEKKNSNNVTDLNFSSFFPLVGFWVGLGEN